jgi:hypothetical protein
MANIAYNNRPHSSVFAELYEECVAARPVIYTGGPAATLKAEHK